MTLEIRNAIRRRDRMRTVTVAKRQVADMMRSAYARFVERDFDPGVLQRVLWSNFLRLRFCNSSSLGVGVEDFADYFANVLFPSVQIPAASGHLGGFSFRHIGLIEGFSAFKRSLLIPWGRKVFLLNFLNYCFHLFVVVCCMFSIMQSPLLFFLPCGRWLLVGRLLRLVYLLVLLTSA
jgi:hypothetical protein